MLSVIICSVDKGLLAQVSKNISETIGVEFELIAIDNSKEPRGITAIYNEGAGRASYENVCFVHEDVLFETPNWGRKVCEIMNDPEIGLLGIAGSGYKSLAPYGWYLEELEHPHKSFQRIRQGYKFKNNPPLDVLHNPNNERLSEVVCIDGVWFCTRKDILKEYPFDELLSGFHSYDVDFSLSVQQDYKIVVTYDIILTHFSEGKFGDEWFSSVLKVQRKWAHFLPRYLPSISKDLVLKTEKIAFKKIILEMVNKGNSFSQIHRMLIGSIKSPLMTPKLFSKLYFYFLKKKLF